MKNFLIFFSLLATFFCNSQIKSSSYQYKWVDNKQGLNQLNVTNCILDNNGFVWLATELGLFKYDGNKVVSFENSDLSEISKKRIIYLWKDPISGEIYFSTSVYGEMYIIKNSIIKKFNDNQGIFVDHSLFLKSTNPFYKAYKNFAGNKSDFSKQIYFNASITNNFMYLWYADKIIRLDKKGNKTIIATPDAKNRVALKFGNTIITIGKKLGCLKQDAITFNSIKADKVINDLINDDEFHLSKPHAVVQFDNEYYLNYKQKLYKVSYKDNYLYTTFLFDLPTNDSKRFSYDKKRRLYFIGTASKGMLIVTKKDFKVIKEENIYRLGDYNIVQKNQKLYNYNGWIFDTKTSKLQIRNINNYFGNERFLLEYNGDYFYQAKKNVLISLLDLKTRAPFKLNNELNFLTSFTYLNKKLWLANELNIGFFQNNKFIFDTQVTKKLKINQKINSITSIGQNLIIATTSGVFFHKPFSSQFNYIKGLENVNARYIKFIDSSNFWVGCYGDGLFLVYKDKVYRVSDKKIHINTTHAIEEDKLGNLWISTNNGLITVNKSKAITSILNNVPIESYLFTVDDGLPTNEFNGGCTQPSLNFNNEMIGFPSMNGYIWFKPEAVNKNFFSGSIEIEEVSVDNKHINSVINNYYTIPKITELVSLKFNYGYYFNRENLTLSYKFEDQDNWTNIKENTIIVPRYKKGVHKLLIKIKTNGFDDKYDVIKSITLDFEPRLNETLWFWLFIFILLLSVIGGTYFLSLTFQIKKEIQLNKKIDEKTIQLQKIINELSASKKIINESLHEKEILIKEVHHRVKNNLQLVMSMLNIQARRKNYDNIFEFLKKGESRINAMALIHQSLYQGNQELNKIILQTYIQDLVDSIYKTFGDNKKIKINVECNSINMNLSTAIPLGLIVNELITNSLKHAFPNNEKGSITIKIKNIVNNQFELIVKDSGVGYNIEIKQVNSFGIELINLLAKQLKGEVTVDNLNKTKYIISFFEIDI